MQAAPGHVINHILVTEEWVADHLLTALTSAIFVSQAVAAAGIVTEVLVVFDIRLTGVQTVTSADFLVRTWA